MMPLARNRRIDLRRAVATQYEKRALNYRVVVVIAALMRWVGAAH